MNDNILKYMCFKSIKPKKNRYRLCGLFVCSYGIGGYVLLRVRCRNDFKYLHGVKQIFWSLEEAEKEIERLAADKLKRDYTVSPDNLLESLNLDEVEAKSKFAETDKNKKADYNPETDRFISLEDLAALTGYSIPTVRQIVREGIKFKQKKGEKRYYSLSDFWTWVEYNKNKIKGPYKKKKKTDAVQMNMF